MAASCNRRQQAPGRHVELDFEAVPTLRMAGPALRSVVYNLLSNALKYAQPGRPPRLHLRSALADGYTVLHVNRQRPRHRPGPSSGRLFQLFRRFHTDVEGSGTGLYLVNRLVQQAGGRVEVQSQVNEGATFSVLLPV